MDYIEFFIYICIHAPLIPACILTCLAATCIFHRKGRFFSSIMCGLILICFLIYYNTFGTYNTALYCNKAEDKCHFMRNSWYSEEFRPYKSFNIHDIADIQYNKEARRGRRGRKYTIENIYFVMKNHTKKEHPFRSNVQTATDLKNFLTGPNKEYKDATNKTNRKLWFGLWILAFILGCSIGIVFYNIWAFLKENVLTPPRHPKTKINLDNEIGKNNISASNNFTNKKNAEKPH